MNVDESIRGEDGAGPDGAGLGVRGERGPAWVKRGRSMQARVQNALAFSVVLALGAAFLGWYYTRVAVAPPPPEQAKAKAAVQGEMRLPPLGAAPARVVRRTEPAVAVDAGDVDGAATSAPSPDLPASAAPSASGVFGNAEEASAFPLLAAAGPGVVAQAGPRVEPVPDPVLQRRLGAPVLIRADAAGFGVSGDSLGGAMDAAPTGARGSLDAARLDGPAASAAGPSEEGPGSAGGGSRLATMLRPARVAAVAAGVLADRRLLLAKGSFIDCTLETAIDSSLPGMTTCVTATDVWSADGSVVLLERGSRLVGETRGEVRQGHERLFVLWSEARTPAGVVVELASPATDALGRSGVAGEVDTHFAARFGAAILISLLDAGTAAAVAAQGSGDGSVLIAPQGSSQVVAAVLEQTVKIAPTLRVAQGERLQVLVARDVSFERVYALAHR